MSTLTQEQQDKIAKFINQRHITEGLGDYDAACSIASINLALTGEFTAEIPECMSEIIGNWVIIIQDCMPNNMRNNADWKSLLPSLAGTGRDYENERLDLIYTWLWDEILPEVKPPLLEDKWQNMMEQRTNDVIRELSHKLISMRIDYSRLHWHHKDFVTLVENLTCIGSKKEAATFSLISSACIAARAAVLAAKYIDVAAVILKPAATLKRLIECKGSLSES